MAIKSVQKNLTGNTHTPIFAVRKKERLSTMADGSGHPDKVGSGRRF
jgi:hypothetical protein